MKELFKPPTALTTSILGQTGAIFGTSAHVPTVPGQWMNEVFKQAYSDRSRTRFEARLSNSDLRLTAGICIVIQT